MGPGVLKPVLVYAPPSEMLPCWVLCASLELLLRVWWLEIVVSLFPCCVCLLGGDLFSAAVLLMSVVHFELDL